MRRRAWLPAALVIHGVAAWAAVSGAQAPADSSAPAKAPMAMAMPMKRWSATLNGMVAYQSTVAAGIHGSTLGVQTAASVGYAAPHGSMTLDATLAYVRTEPDPASIDQWGLGLGGRHDLAPRLLLLGRATYDVSRIQNLEYRWIHLAGVGVVVVKRPAMTWIVAPGLGYTRSKQNAYGRVLSFAAGRPPGAEGVAAGAHDMLMLQLSPMLSVQQTFLWLHGIGSQAYDESQLQVQLTGMVAKGFGLTIAYTQQYDSSMPPPVERTLRTLNSGIQVSF
jgi:hypothetical protein